MTSYRYKTGLGQDSHRFLPEGSAKPCIIGGVIFSDAPGLSAHSDGDVVFHALCNAITSITTVPILGGIANELCLKDGITDSLVYLQKALDTLKETEVVHIALSLEAKRPRLEKRLPEIRKNVAAAARISIQSVGATATSGDGLTDFGCGDGIQCFCILTVREKID